MPVKYDEYYSAQDHALGPAYADVIAFFQNLEVGQTVLDVGVRQGRDAIPLAQMGHRVIGIDLSSIGIEQLKMRQRRSTLTLMLRLLICAPIPRPSGWTLSYLIARFI